MNLLPLLIGSLAFAIILMALSWWQAKRWNFYSLVDIAWTYGIGVMVIGCCYFGTAPWQRLVLIAAIGISWSLRLGTHLFFRLQKSFPVEDTRYAKLKLSWGPIASKKFFWFFQFQAVSQPIFVLPFALAVLDDSPTWHFNEILGLVMYICGWIGESVADAQLKAFKRNENNHGKVCNIGLWYFSRHPNYFFEWIIWCGIALTAMAAPHGGLALICPSVMYYILNFVTGIPPAEQQSLASRGELYREYQRRTNAFFPWKPRP